MHVESSWPEPVETTIYHKIVHAANLTKQKSLDLILNGKTKFGCALGCSLAMGNDASAIAKLKNERVLKSHVIFSVVLANIARGFYRSQLQTKISERISGNDILNTFP